MGGESAHYAAFVASVIDRTIYLKYHELYQAGLDQLIESGIAQSNAEFDVMTDREEYIAATDEDWTSTPVDGTTPLMDGILESNISSRIRDELVQHYIEEHAVMIYSSVAVLNKYGAVIGMSTRTANYCYEDSAWWAMAIERGHYFSEIEVDPITNTHGLCICVRLTDSMGNTFGMMMAFLNIAGVVEESVYAGKPYHSTQFRLISLDGRVIYSEGAFHVLEDVSDQEYFQSITQERGYFLADESERNWLFAYSESSGYLRYDGGDWYVVVAHDSSEVLKPVEELRTSIAMASAVVIVGALGMYWFFSYSISRRIQKLSSIAKRFSKGNLEERVHMAPSDEIGQLGVVFNNMASELGTLYHDLEDRVKIRTTELEQAMKKLQLLGSITRHDALNQVAVINGWIAIVEDSTDDEEVRAKLRKISDASANLERYLKFTGVYERVGVKEPEWMELGSVLTESMFGLGPRSFELDNGLDGLEILADPMFPKVLRNLLDNTIAHGGEVTRVSFSYSENPDGLAIVYEDDGIGIPEDRKESIFERTANSGRTSFGLYLSTEILSITGMSMRETGVPGKGARFEILVQRGYYRIGKAS